MFDRLLYTPMENMNNIDKKGRTKMIGDDSISGF